MGGGPRRHVELVRDRIHERVRRRPGRDELHVPGLGSQAGAGLADGRLLALELSAALALLPLPIPLLPLPLLPLALLSLLPLPLALLALFTLSLALSLSLPLALALPLPLRGGDGGGGRDGHDVVGGRGHDRGHGVRRVHAAGVQARVEAGRRRRAERLALVPQNCTATIFAEPSSTVFDNFLRGYNFAGNMAYFVHVPWWKCCWRIVHDNLSLVSSITTGG